MKKLLIALCCVPVFAGAQPIVRRMVSEDLTQTVSNKTMVNVRLGATSSVVGYAWKATDTMGHGSWQSVGAGGLSSSDSALINSKYSASNPAGYTSNTGTVTSGSGGSTGLTLTGSTTLTLDGTLGLANGGTGGTDAATARANLGIANLADSPAFRQQFTATSGQTLFNITAGTIPSDTNKLHVYRNGLHVFRPTFSSTSTTVTFASGVTLNDNITVEVDGNGFGPGSSGYVLPTASASVLGGVKVGTGLSIDGSGVLSSSGGGGGSAVDTQWFYTSQNWYKPAGAKVVEIHLIAAGGGGGSGRKGAAGTLRAGGGGGGGGGYSKVTYPASYLTDTVLVTIGAAGNGGSSQTTNSTSGTPGGSASPTTFGKYLRALGGSGGGGGTTSTGAAGAAGSGLYYVGTAGAAGNGSSGGNSPAPLWNPNGGPAGGGVSAANVVNGGGNGNVMNGFVNESAPSTNAGAAGNDGGAGSDARYFGPAFAPGGGGASNTGNGGNGGTQGTRCFGAGGAGGGASTDSVGDSGAGSAGGPGVALIITYK